MDNLTGLPQVHVDEFWRVEHPYKEGTYSWYTSKFPRDKTRLQVSLMRRNPPYRRVERYGPFGWLKRYVTEDSAPTSLYTEVAQGTHPVALVNAANRIMSKRAKDDLTRALVGDYPPKALVIPDAD